MLVVLVVSDLGSKGERGRVHDFLERLGLVQKYKKLGRNRKWVQNNTKEIDMYKT